jgi:hypothetical protein
MGKGCCKDCVELDSQLSKPGLCPGPGNKGTGPESQACSQARSSPSSHSRGKVRTLWRSPPTRPALSSRGGKVNLFLKRRGFEDLTFGFSGPEPKASRSHPFGRDSSAPLTGCTQLHVSSDSMTGEQEPGASFPCDSPSLLGAVFSDLWLLDGDIQGDVWSVNRPTQHQVQHR